LIDPDPFKRNLKARNRFVDPGNDLAMCLCRVKPIKPAALSADSVGGQSIVR
jgi:hypothetical protein